jgi:hypothetical protein
MARGCRIMTALGAQVLKMDEVFHADDTECTGKSCGYVFPPAAVAKPVSFLQSSRREG